MPQTSLHAAIERLDRIVSRLESAEGHAPRPTPGLAEAYAVLDERHGLLRLRIQETIERLDGLIEAEVAR